jgi:hypothetical protein
MHNIATPELPIVIKEARDLFLIETGALNDQLGNKSSSLHQHSKQ